MSSTSLNALQTQLDYFQGSVQVLEVQASAAQQALDAALAISDRQLDATVASAVPDVSPLTLARLSSAYPGLDTSNVPPRTRWWQGILGAQRRDRALSMMRERYRSHVFGPSECGSAQMEGELARLRDEHSREVARLDEARALLEVFRRAVFQGKQPDHVEIERAEAFTAKVRRDAYLEYLASSEANLSAPPPFWTRIEESPLSPPEQHSSATPPELDPSSTSHVPFPFVEPEPSPEPELRHEFLTQPLASGRGSESVVEEQNHVAPVDVPTQSLAEILASQTLDPAAGLQLEPALQVQPDLFDDD